MTAISDPLCVCGGARLMAVITHAGIGWTLARTWKGSRAPAQAPRRRVAPLSDLPRQPS